jgi:hypothetical protein
MKGRKMGATYRPPSTPPRYTLHTHPTHIPDNTHHTHPRYTPLPTNAQHSAARGRTRAATLTRCGTLAGHPGPGSTWGSPCGHRQSVSAHTPCKLAVSGQGEGEGGGGGARVKAGKGWQGPGERHWPSPSSSPSLARRPSQSQEHAPLPYMCASIPRLCVRHGSSLHRLHK